MLVSGRVDGMVLECLWMLVDSSIGPTFFGSIRTSLLNFMRTYDDSRVEDFRLRSGEVSKWQKGKKIHWTLI